MTQPPLSGHIHIDALLGGRPGWSVLQPERNVLYYTFSVDSGNEAGNAYIADALTAFNDQQQGACIELLDQLNRITGIHFAVASAAQDADLHFAATDITTSSRTVGMSSWSEAWSGNSLDSVVGYRATAYVYLDNLEWREENAAPAPGNQAYQTLLHELGHVLGLKHPFSGTPVLPSEEDNTANTRMSYTVAGGPYADLGPYDVAALNWLYGGDGFGGALGVGTPAVFLTGTVADDLLAGGDGNDRLEGLSGCDILAGGPGDDTLDGGDAVDVVRVGGSRSDYLLTLDSAGYSLADRLGVQGSDRLVNVERLEFADAQVALDIDGAAGCVVRILGAVFGADAYVMHRDFVGVGLDLLDGGMESADLMQFALDVRLGAGFSAADEITLLYQNLVATPPTAGECEYWMATLATGEYTPAGLAMMAAWLEVNEMNINLAGLRQTGVEYLS